MLRFEADAVLGAKLATYDMPKGGGDPRTNTKKVSVATLKDIPEITLKRSAATQKLAGQLLDEEKSARADFVVDTRAFGQHSRHANQW